MLGVSSCAAGRFFRPELRVGLHTDYPPISFEQGGEIVGIEPDLARLVGRELGRRVRFVELGRGRLIDALESERIDVIMAGMSITSERRERVRFVLPYTRVGQMVVLRRDRIDDLGHPRHLRRAGLRMGFVSGTTGEIFVRERLPEAHGVPFSLVADAEFELRRGTIDYLVHDAPTAWRLGMDLQDEELIAIYRPLTEEWLAWAVRPGDEELATALDELATRWSQDGTIERVISAWVPVRIVQ